MYLVDTNIFVEILLRQERTEEAKQFLNTTPANTLYCSEFSVYSIGIILLQRKKPADFLSFIQDTFEEKKVHNIRLSSEDMHNIVEFADAFNLDFDDAYQYAVSEKYGLEIVCFDTDFDRTERGRKTPVQIMNME